MIGLIANEKNLRRKAAGLGLKIKKTNDHGYMIVNPVKNTIIPGNNCKAYIGDIDVLLDNYAQRKSAI